ASSQRRTAAIKTALHPEPRTAPERGASSESGAALTDTAPVVSAAGTTPTGSEARAASGTLSRGTTRAPTIVEAAHVATGARTPVTGRCPLRLGTSAAPVAGRRRRGWSGPALRFTSTGRGRTRSRTSAGSRIRTPVGPAA